MLQLLEDFQPFTTVDWNSNIASKGAAAITCPLKLNTSSYSTRPAVAWGSCVGLKVLMTLTAKPTTVGSSRVNAVNFLNAFLTRWSTKVPVIVTGHSLGGTQTTAVSLYLASRNSKASIGAFPFAPSTAGNAAFAALWNTTLGSRSQLYMNTLDLVPHGYQYIPATLGLWFLYGGPLPPDYLIPLVPLVYAGVKSIGYTHPNPNNWMVGKYNPLATTLYPSNSSWASQLEYQHFPPTYYSMLCYYFAQVSGGGNVRKTMEDYPLLPITGSSAVSYSGCKAVLGRFGAIKGPGGVLKRP